MTPPAPEAAPRRWRMRWQISLFWRTFFLLALLLALSGAVWLQALFTLEFAPRRLHMAQQMAALMSDALLAFARSGNPNHSGLPNWEQYSLDRRQTMIFDVPSRQQDDPRGGERRLYQQVPYLQRGTM